ncbi:MAG: thiamine pyrophosphate-dependent enzyme [Bacteroidota bacterium]
MEQEQDVIENPNAVFIQEILNDFKLACLSREASLLGRKEVLTGKAKFGIFGDGKELAQLCAAKQFRNGDFRSGYYRDSTFMLALGQTTVQQLFAGLYAHTDVEAEPTSGGRQMGGHFATRNLNADGTWKNLMEQKNSSADISPTAGQMPRLLGLAQASKIYRHNELLNDFTNFSNGGNEVAFGTIGDASTSEGLFWETMNAAGVMQVPMVMSVWDDGYGISVPKKYQTTKGSISDALAGFQREEGKLGFEIFKTKGWDYAHLIQTYEEAVELARTQHIPVLVHVEEVTQPQGHSTSGSHERYKDNTRLDWEKEYDCINQFRNWILNFNIEGEAIATAEQLDQLSNDARKEVREQQKAAWTAFGAPLKQDLTSALDTLGAFASETSKQLEVAQVIKELKGTIEPIRKDIFSAVRKVLRITRGEDLASRRELVRWLKNETFQNQERYSSNLYSESAMSPLKVEEVPVQYDSNPEQVDGRIILRDNFDAIFAKYPESLSFGEDLGKIGGVNQSWEGMQAKYGELRVSDVGIREATILGQGIGLAMRGLRPIAEIQYLDYIFYALQIMSDDLATVQYRTKGGQKAPVIISTRGHRLEGIWHAGSPMGAIINMIRGVHVCVPRNMTTAAGFYNTLMRSDDPAVVVEPLNGYRSKEPMPANIGEFTIPLGVPEVVREGSDLTLVSYGSTFNLCIIAAEQLAELGISVELVDARTLLPFDVNGMIRKSLEKTNRLLIVDEDVSSGATAFMLDQILTVQNGYELLDSKPETLSAKDHRPAYGTDGDYFSKPSIDDIVEKAYQIMQEAKPSTFPSLF